MPVYQSEPNFNFCYWMVGANSGLTFVSGNIYMEHFMEYMWNIYNILVIKKKKPTRGGKQLLCTPVLITRLSLSCLTKKRVYTSFISRDADAENMGSQTNGRNGAPIPESALLAGGRSSKSRGSFWVSFPVRHQGRVRTHHRHSRVGFWKDCPPGEHRWVTEENLGYLSSISNLGSSYTSKTTTCLRRM